MNIKSLISLLIVLFIIAGCSGGENGSASDNKSSADQNVEKQKRSGPEYGKEEVRNAVANLHGLYNKEEYKKLFGMATQSMRDKLTEKQFTKLITDIRDKLGTVKSADIANMSNHAESGRVIVNLDVDYENESGTEKWTLVMSGEDLKWEGFDYDAPSL